MKRILLQKDDFERKSFSGILHVLAIYLGFAPAIIAMPVDIRCQPRPLPVRGYSPQACRGWCRWR
jgi:hypothetical protein